MRVNKHIIQRYSDLNVYRHPEKPPVYIAIGGSVYTPDFIYFWQIGDVPHATDVPYKSPELRRLWGQNVECLRSESLRGERPFEKNDNMYEFLWKPLGLSEKAFDSIDNIKAWEMPTFNEEMKKLGYTKEKLMIKHKYIDEVEEGDIVLAHQPNYGDIAIVKKCVHGNLYYACYEDDTIDTSTLPLVADADRNHIECCS